MKPVLIDYGAGNLLSVANALRAAGAEPVIAAEPSQLENATHLILPGVGSFGDCMEQLAARDLLAPVRAWATSGRPYLGICLGYQILFDSSEESPGISGLGILSGSVVRFPIRPGLKVPHMGWNAAVPRHPDTPLWKGLGANPYFYFVHSYFPAPADDTVIAADTRYDDIRFASAVEKDNLVACQFHPEKSQTAGLQLLRNFLAKE